LIKIKFVFDLHVMQGSYWTIRSEIKFSEQPGPS